MRVNECRVCGHRFFEDPLLQCENMPKAAQWFPDEASLEKDKGMCLVVCQCSGCGLVQLSNEPVPYYREVIRSAAFSEEMKAYRVEQFNHFVEQYTLKGKKIIEVGCGRGEYLSILKQCGLDAYGIENSSDSVEYCIRQDLHVSEDFIESSYQKLKHAPFDAFCIFNYLEHIPHPNEMLRGIYHNIKNQGIGIIEVPNFNMMLEKHLISEFISDHLLYFTRDTLVTTLQQNGFDILECYEVWYDYIIKATVKKRPQLDLSHFRDCQLQLKHNLHQYIHRYGDKRVAIWGAGHQALASIALAEVTNRIKYVVDSAPFKQDKFTPVTHIPIVSPERLNSDPVDAIIVMAAGYSDEVAGIIRQRFDQRVDVAILRDADLEIV